MAVTQEIMNLETSNMSHCLILTNVKGNLQNFPLRGRGLGHVTHNTIEHIFKTT